MNMKCGPQKKGRGESGREEKIWKKTSQPCKYAREAGLRSDVDSINDSYLVICNIYIYKDFLPPMTQMDPKKCLEGNWLQTAVRLDVCWPSAGTCLTHSCQKALIFQLKFQIRSNTRAL